MKFTCAYHGCDSTRVVARILILGIERGPIAQGDLCDSHRELAAASTHTVGLPWREDALRAIPAESSTFELESYRLRSGRWQ